ncbi:MAG TPA: 4-alpha-glucanotransferase [Candidatus Dormibacteraeota bacterium]
MHRVRNWGVQPVYRDWRQELREASPAAVEAVLQALGAESEAPPRSPVLSVFQGDRTRLRGEVRLEGGGSVRVDGPLPDSVPPGYHRLGERLLIVAPPSAPQPAFGWGWAVQLYALRSQRSCELGDLDDLRRLGRWSARLGASVLLLSPLHAVAPGKPQQPSPYYPTSRLYRNPLYLAVPGQRAHLGPVIDRDRAFDLKLAALEAAFRDVRGSHAFEAYRRSEGAELESFAGYCAALDGRSAEFHAWLQWRLDVQLEAAAREIGLIHDLAVGVDPDGADARAWRDVFASEVRIGAPPDEFATAGQDWALPPFDPWKLRDALYEPFIKTLRAAFRHGRGVRIDHVMGLFRLWWIPPGAEPGDGAYVRYPWRDLLAILVLEASRAGAFVVGEDLGTVEPWVRRELRRRGVLSYRVLWFEDRRPEWYPSPALAAVTTHDLPTIAGAWSGADAGAGPMRARLQRLTRSPAEADVADVTLQTYEALAEAPSRLITATLEDATGMVERPNLPGTIDERPNWRLPLPLTLEELERAPLPRAIAAALSRRKAS